MPYRFLADLVVTLHLLFVLFVLLGGLLALRWPRVAWLHLPAAVWGALIEFTGGICPLTACTKSLISGACGGANHGKCEISQDRDCGWELIYERLKERGLLDRLDDLMKPLEHKKIMIRPEMMATPRYGIENPPEVKKPAEEVKVK